MDQKREMEQTLRVASKKGNNGITVPYKTRRIRLNPFDEREFCPNPFDTLFKTTSSTKIEKITTSTFPTKSTSTLVSTSTKTRQNIEKRIDKKPNIATGDKEETTSLNTQVVTTTKRRSTIITRSKSKTQVYEQNASKQVEVSVNRWKKSTKTLVTTSVKTIPNIEEYNVSTKRARKDIRSNISVIATGDEPAIKSTQVAQIKHKRAQMTIVTRSRSRTQENDRKVTKQATELSVNRDARSQKKASTENMSRDRATKSVDTSTVDKHANASNKSSNQVPVNKNIFKSTNQVPVYGSVFKFPTSTLHQSTPLTGNENRRQVPRLKV